MSEIDRDRCLVAFNGTYDEDLVLRSWKEDSRADEEWFRRNGGTRKRVRVPTALERMAFNLSGSVWIEVQLLPSGETMRFFMTPRKR